MDPETGKNPLVRVHFPFPKDWNRRGKGGENRAVEGLGLERIGCSLLPPKDGLFFHCLKFLLY